MSDYSSFELREVSPDFKLSMSSVYALLEKCGLKYEKLDYMAAIFDSDGKAYACGGYQGRTIKCIAVTEEARGEGLSNQIISHLLQRLLSENGDCIRLFTKPENEEMFLSFGFKLIARADKAIFMERGRGLEEYLDDLKCHKTDGVNGCLVMNCNPFTKGHLYLAEYASQRCDTLYIFVVSEDMSLFPSKIRYDLVKSGLSHLKNVKVLEGGQYVISQNTFPSYFIKEYSDVTKAHTQLDISVFSKYICPILNIKKRFVGEELTDRVTLEYNKTMLEILPKNDIEVNVISRKCDDEGNVISASKVRKAIFENDFDTVKCMVPECTYEYLTSDNAKDVIEKIKNEYR